MDIEKLLSPVSDGDPCGPNLEYEDPAYFQLHESIERPADSDKGPDWAGVVSDACELLGRTKDLRIALQVARGGLRSEGFSGFRDGLALLAGLLDRFWAELHPKLDEEDGDATARLMTVLSLCHAGELHAIKQTPIVRSRGAGAFSYRDIQLVEGKVPPADGEELPDANLISAAFVECPHGELTATATAIDEAVEQVDAIDKQLTEALGSSGTVDLEPLRGALVEIGALLKSKIPDEPGEMAAAEDGGGDGAGTTVTAVAGVRSRQDAIRALDQICTWFEVNEPSSPVPILLRRAQKLIDKSFMDIVKDLTPDGMKQIEVFSGESSDE